MSELPILYRVAEGGPFDIQVDNGVTIENITDDLVNAKILIPDTCLQSIADAPRCEHDRIDEHEWPVEVPGVNKPLYDWCEGAPGLRALLKALEKDNSDE